MSRGRILLPVIVILVTVAVVWLASCSHRVASPHSRGSEAAQRMTFETAIATASDTPTATITPTATPTITPTVTSTPTQAPPSFPSSSGTIARFRIPELGVDAPVESLGVDATNTMETPAQPYTDVGWYHDWTAPGAVGNAVFAAHVYWHSVPAPFNRIANLATGDEVDVVMNGGATYRYQVITNNDYSLSTLNMSEVIWPSERPADAQWITLITCAGGTAANGYTYDDRVVVQAQRIG
ncbi:MAG TPA: class F sortase [Tepidiformaceae bacterium]|nr:class F sortase [Tepidiformaceae bacterium]